MFRFSTVELWILRISGYQHILQYNGGMEYGSYTYFRIKRLHAEVELPPDSYLTSQFAYFMQLREQRPA